MRSLLAAQKAELSSGGEWAGALNGSQRAPWMTGLSTLYGLQSFQPYLGYGGGSYVLDIDGYNRTRALEQLAEMKREFWIDQGTRAVSVDINLYNTYSKVRTREKEVEADGVPEHVAKFWSFEQPFASVLSSGAHSHRSHVNVDCSGLLVYVTVHALVVVL